MQGIIMGGLFRVCAICLGFVCLWAGSEMNLPPRIILKKKIFMSVCCGHLSTFFYLLASLSLNN